MRTKSQDTSLPKGTFQSYTPKLDISGLAAIYKINEAKKEMISTIQYRGGMCGSPSSW